MRNKQKIKNIVFEHEDGIAKAYLGELSGTDFDYDVLAEVRQKTWKELEKLFEEMAAMEAEVEEAGDE